MRRAGWIALAGLLASAAGLAVGFALGHDTGRGRVITRTTREEQLPIAATRGARGRPKPVPTRFAANYDPRHVPLQELIPADAEVVSAWYLEGSSEQIAVAWLRAEDRGGGPGIFGLAIWRRKEFGTTVGWFRMYSHRRWLEGIEIQTGDLTHDGRSDLLVREDTGGSAGCAIYRVLSPRATRVRQIYVRRHCLDQGRIRLLGGTLVEIDGVQHVGASIHCCYRYTLRRVKRWNGRSWETVQRTLSRNRPGTWPPS